MKIDEILISKQIDPSEIVLQITAEEVLNSINEMLNEFSFTIDFNKFTKQELEKLFLDFADAVVTYHPQNYHQERAAVLENKTVFKKFGLTERKIQKLDFS
jgi:hypothetical protein